MILSSSISELKTGSAKAAKTTKPNIDHIIKWYEALQITRFKTAFIFVVALGCPMTVQDGRADPEYNRIVAQV